MNINMDRIIGSSAPIVPAIGAEAASQGCAVLNEIREASGRRMEWTGGIVHPVPHRLE